MPVTGQALQPLNYSLCAPQGSSRLLWAGRPGCYRGRREIIEAKME